MMGSNTKQNKKKNFNLWRLIFPDNVVHVRRWQLVLVFLSELCRLETSLPRSASARSVWYSADTKSEIKKKQNNTQVINKTAQLRKPWNYLIAKTNKTHSDRTEREFQEVHPTVWHVSGLLPKREKQKVAVPQQTLCRMYRSTVESTFWVNREPPVVLLLHRSRTHIYSGFTPTKTMLPLIFKQGLQDFNAMINTKEVWGTIVIVWKKTNRCSEPPVIVPVQHASPSDNPLTAPSLLP